MNFVCWLNRPNQTPMLLDGQQPINNYSLVSNDPIMVLKAGDKPEDFLKVQSFHNNINVTIGDGKDKPKKTKKNLRKSLSLSKLVNNIVKKEKKNLPPPNNL